MIIIIILLCVQGVNKIDTRDYSSPHTLVRGAAYYFDRIYENLLLPYPMITITTPIIITTPS
jgi:hypothetical protein